MTINGSNFDPDPFHMVVAFGTVQATIVSSSATQIVVNVPAGAVTAPISVTNGLTQASTVSSSNFTVTGTVTQPSWISRSAGTSYLLNATSFGGNTFVAVGEGGTIVHSSDGASWSPAVAPGFTQGQVLTLMSLTYAGTQFIATGTLSAPNPSNPSGAWISEAYVISSANGVNWTRQAVGSAAVPTSGFNDLFGDANLITGVTEGAVSVSTDGGASWTSQALPAQVILGKINGIAASATTRVLVANNGIAYSTDATTWQAVALPAGFVPQEIAWNGQVFVAVGGSILNAMALPVAATSFDGQNWTVQAMPSEIATSQFMLEDVTWDGSRFIAVGSPYALVGRRLALTSPDGVSWTVDLNSDSGSGMRMLDSVTSNGVRAVAVGSGVYTKDF